MREKRKEERRAKKREEKREEKREKKENKAEWGRVGQGRAEAEDEPLPPNCWSADDAAPIIGAAPADEAEAAAASAAVGAAQALVSNCISGRFARRLAIERRSPAESVEESVRTVDENHLRQSRLTVFSHHVGMRRVTELLLPRNSHKTKTETMTMTETTVVVVVQKSCRHYETVPRGTTLNE